MVDIEGLVEGQIIEFTDNYYYSSKYRASKGERGIITMVDAMDDPQFRDTGLEYAWVKIEDGRFIIFLEKMSL